MQHEEDIYEASKADQLREPRPKHLFPCVGRAWQLHRLPVNR